MSRTRVAGIVRKLDQILLMERKKDGKHYFVFPGGSPENGEDEITTLRREIREETTIEITVESATIIHGKTIYYLCSYLSGTVKLPKDSIEQTRIDQEGQFYKPQWVNISAIKTLPLLPLSIRDIVGNGSFDI